MTNKQSYAGLLERPFTYAYRYPAWPPDGATVIRFGTNGREVNGVKPIEAIPLYSAEAISSLLKALEYARGSILGQQIILKAMTGRESLQLETAIEKIDAALNSDSPLSTGDGL